MVKIRLSVIGHVFKVHMSR